MIIEEFLNQILKPYTSIILSNPELKIMIESLIMKYQFEFDTSLTRDQLRDELVLMIKDYIIENRNTKIDNIL